MDHFLFRLLFDSSVVNFGSNSRKMIVLLLWVVCLLPLISDLMLINHSAVRSETTHRNPSNDSIIYPEKSITSIAWSWFSPFIVIELDQGWRDPPHCIASDFASDCIDTRCQSTRVREREKVADKHVKIKQQDFFLVLSCDNSHRSPSTNQFGIFRRKEKLNFIVDETDSNVNSLDDRQ